MTKGASPRLATRMRALNNHKKYLSGQTSDGIKVAAPSLKITDSNTPLKNAKATEDSQIAANEKGEAAQLELTREYDANPKTKEALRHTEKIHSLNQ